MQEIVSNYKDLELVQALHSFMGNQLSPNPPNMLESRKTTFCQQKQLLNQQYIQQQKSFEQQQAHLRLQMQQFGNVFPTCHLMPCESFIFQQSKLKQYKYVSSACHLLPCKTIIINIMSKFKNLT